MLLSVPEKYPAESNYFEKTMTCHNGNVGFRVPEYQRTYDWDEDNIKRLLEDCLNRFYNLSRSSTESYTFLGTLILVNERSESSFDGTSLSVVDGQQRLITLILLCCALVEQLFCQEEDAHHLQEPTINWIKKEIEFILGRLYDCVIGQLRSSGQTSGFPRVVRSPEDNRAFSHSEAKYHSVIAKFLYDFNNYYLQQDNSAFTPIQTNENAETSRFFQNYEYIKKQVKLGIYKGNDTSNTGDQSELDFNQIDHDNFQNPRLYNLFEKLDTLSDQAERDIVISDITNNSDSSGLIRLMLFSHYVLKSVVLTRIETIDEDAAFDIFDSLNTTGEPLSAIETFKPHVMSFERENGYTDFSITESAKQFERLEENLNHIYLENDKRQKETRELLVTFALYMEGHKLPENLADQRIYLRAKFEGAANTDLKRRIVQSLADIAEFRQTYWNRDSIRNLDSIHNDTNNRLKLCCVFISDMKTSLALPIMARYWAQYQQDGNEDTFADAVMALTAFLVLRRSITGTTGGIDTDFRKMMGTLCTGLDYSNSLSSLNDLKKILRKYLAASRIGVNNKETWVSQVCEVPLARHAKPLCRFLLFAASDNARTDQGNSGLLTREQVIPDDQLAYLNFSKWQDAKYATVEHVAPDSNSGGWDEEIYRLPHTRHTIGNTILLPQKENSSLGNAPWTKKKLFYRTLAAKTEEERKSQFEQAKEEGLTFPKRTENLLKKQVRLDMLDPIAEVSDWTKGLIQKRTENILQLAWDVIAPWLGYQ
ncbi:MAG: DUF262 domain-containing HNH endonuclease family protein [Candidatus Poribacteria bacterium]|nr:DUF262 domain-containing HNH endonuclease family protein [Candidatus Poribacteria bacterium]